MEQAAEMNKGFSESAERTTTINEYENASVRTTEQFNSNVILFQILFL